MRARLHRKGSLAPTLHQSAELDERDIIDTLSEAHEQLRALIDDLRVEQDPASRRGVLRRLKSTLSLHYYAEERVVYRALRQLSSGPSRAQLRQALTEHAGPCTCCGDSNI